MARMAKMRFADNNDHVPTLTYSFLKRILSYFSPYPFKLISIIFLTLGSAALGVVPALILQKIIDQVLPQKNISNLVLFIGLSFLTSLTLNLMNVLQGYLSTWVAKHITFEIKNQLYEHLTHLPQSFFAEEKEGEILTRLTSDVDGIQQVFQTTIISALTSVFILLTSAVTLFKLNPILALVSISFLPLFIFPTRRVGKIRWKITGESQRELSQLNAHVQESMSTGGSLLMKLFTNEEKNAREFSKTNKKVITLQLKEILAGRWFRMTMSLFTTTGPLIVYLIGGYLFTKNQMTIGSILTFATLLQRMYDPVTQLFNIQVDFMRSFALFDRIFEYLDLPLEKDVVDASSSIKITKGEIVFDDVSFAHEKRDNIKNITLTIPAGKTTAIVGPSGAGKSTLTNLIPRLYLPTKGRITIDDIPLNDFSLKSLRKEIGMVTQESLLLNGSIADNLRYAKADATKEEMEEASKAAYLHDFIMTLPKGYDTQVGNHGVKLSGGEKQRLAIARVLLKDPKILILDEATAALDTISEFYVQKAMKVLMKNRTSIVIAHRLSTITDANQIVVMEKGEIKEVGTHQELMQKGGLYYKLQQAQMKKSA